MTSTPATDKHDPPLVTTAGLSTPALLSTLWIFASLNYLYCDLVGLMDADNLRDYLAGRVSGMDMSHGFLLGATILVEIPMAMVLVSRIVAHRSNRIANVAAGTFMTLVQVGTLFVGTTTPAYLFSSIVEIATTTAVVWIAWHWTQTAPSARV